MNAQLDISQNKALLWLMAIACGLCAGANYYSQPLIHSIQLYFNMPESQVALTVTFAQVSYALGLLFIVPMGDIVNKIKFIPWLMFCAAIGLLMCAFAVNLPMLWVGTIITGLFSVAAQVLIPLATMAVKPEKTGEVVGFLMSGLLVGLLLSTSLAGLLSNLFNWKLIYFVSAVLMLILAYLLKKRLPHVPVFKMSYGKIFYSMGVLLKEERRLVYRAIIGGFAFAAMSILFSTIAVLLTSEPFKLPDVLVGVATIIGVFGALATAKIGKIADRGHTSILTWIGVALMIISWALLYFGGKYLTSYILGYGLISFGLAVVHTSNQNIIFRLRPDAKSRINSIYMTAYFTGGACGSALGVYAWHHGGWTMTCLVGVCLVMGSALFSLLDRLYLNRAQTI
ncbi:MFS transporter [Acinetobacter sp. ULE_I001]|jgi:predicted MFS family arabinose efflux permease|uniref:MFS transporter n=1 Tax=Acinetobacter TaxID=469 RepID=UPI001EF05D1A|nr:MULTISPECIES: MFS transporter [unclassified Acinetobacter]MCG7222404.1 MFS transporter [Acinetobacter sp. AG3]MDN6081720.1 MFS transporter [Leuconostoc sp.]UOH19200.1 MFS transporter [Acinetobacter sp. NyZ410]